jgi:hypothetical protein
MRMSRRIVPVSIIAGLLVLIFACYGDALFRGRQFAYRDAAHFYYPLYERVQAEWQAGRWPLWEPEENGGMPLLGNPTAAVLYPGKLLYGVLPYPWAARLYIVAHSLLAFATMGFLLRSWGTSLTGAAIAAFSYAFGLPILFQYCNVIFLVGAAWLPLGFRAADRWLRSGRRAGLIELALVLALQILGGDPQEAYLLGVCAAGYALALTGSRSGVWSRLGRRRIAVVALGLFVFWIGATLVLAVKLPAFRPPRGAGKPALAFPWMVWVPMAVVAAWAVAGAFLLARWRRSGWRLRLGGMLAGLIGSALLAGGLAAIQLLPILEFIRQSGRAAGQGPHDIFPFSLEPIRIVEFLWPNVFGTVFAGNQSWLGLIPPVRQHAEIWIPSLYLGGLTILLALGALGFRDGPPWRGWLSAIAIVTLLASLGEYTGPLWWARSISHGASLLGPHDGHDTTAIRLDAQLRDGDGSFYWFLATALPGFRQFRFPSKLLTFTALALAALAGLGWDRLSGEPRAQRRLVRLAAGLCALSVCTLIGAIAGQPTIIAALRHAAKGAPASPFGPVDPAAAYRQLCLALVQGSVVLAAGVVFARWARRAAGLAGALAVLVTVADLAVANARFVITVPQHLFETSPKVIQIIADAERTDPSPGPYRVHRMPYWQPMGWLLRPSRDRVRDFVVWERETIQPKYGLHYGVHYTLSLGVAELYDYEWYFGGFLRAARPDAARLLHVRVGEQIVVYPRRAFDLWNTRYFVLPAFPGGWAAEQRGYAAFLPSTDQIYPTPDQFDAPDGEARQKHWLEDEDYQVLRNRDAYPRAWIVHEARFLKPITGLERTDRDVPMQEILFANDYLWNDSTQPVYDPHRLAWVEVDPARQPELLAFLPGRLPGGSERVTVTYRSPQHVELEADLDRPGLVVLADIYYPGWKLTIDGALAPIYRANRLMRGAAVKAGKHHLVYAYQPQSFAIGAVTSIVALALVAGLVAAFRLRPVSAVIAAEEASPPASTPLPPQSVVVE